MRRENRRRSGVLVGVWVTVAVAGCGGQDASEVTSTPYVLGVTVPEDVSGARLRTVHPGSAGSATIDTSATRFGIHIPVATSPIPVTWPDTAPSWELSDSALSDDPDGDTRRVLISLRSDWGADMVELQFPPGARIMTVNGMEAQQPGNATAEIWRSRVGGVRDTVIVELPARCDVFPVVIAQHFLRPFGAGVLEDSVVDSLRLDSHFRVMTSREDSLDYLPNCCR